MIENQRTAEKRAEKRALRRAAYRLAAMSGIPVDTERVRKKARRRACKEIHDGD